MLCANDSSTYQMDNEEPRKRSRIACVPCRQAKVKCDLKSIPCLRCQKLGIDCSVNPGFKRANRRDKVNELEDNVQRLQNLVEKQQGPATTLTPASVDGLPRFVSLGNNISSSNLETTLSETQQQLFLNQRASVGSSGDTKTLGAVILNNEEVTKLFQLYFDKFHAYFPILDPTRSADAYYESSTLLFWTIISVSLRFYKQANETLENLITPLSAHIWTEIGSSRKNQVGIDASNITEIQALLLLTTWPLPNVRLWSDRSLIMAQMALTSAMHIGLHRPGYDFEYARNPPVLDENNFHERSTAWVAAYSLSVSLALEYGHVPLVPTVDWVVNKVCMQVPQVHVPQDLRHFAIIYKHANDGFQRLAQMHENPALVAEDEQFFVNMARFETVLLETRELHGEGMSLCNRTRLQGIILLVQMMYFLSDQRLEQTKQGLLRAYSTATVLVSGLIAEDNVNDFMACAPYAIMRVLLRSAFTILRLLFSIHGKQLDRASGKIIFDTATLLLRQMAIQKNSKDDMPNRVAEALRLTWKHMERDSALLQQPPTLKIKSRLAASMQYDCLLYYREAVRAKNSQGQEKQRPVMTSASSALSTEAFESQWSTPSFESFMETDLSWLDEMIDPAFQNGE